MASITKSEIVSDSAQVDGRRWIHERFTDSLNAVHDKHYLCEANFDANAQLSIDATQLLTDLVNGEITQDLQAIQDRGANAAITTNYCTMDQLTAQARVIFATAVGQNAVALGEWFNTLTFAQLQKAFGFPNVASYNAFKNAWFVPNANTANSIRSATGA